MEIVVKGERGDGGGEGKKEFGKTVRAALDNDGVKIRNGEAWIKKKNLQKFA